MSTAHWHYQITDFLGYVQSIKKLSPHTLSNYQRDLKKFSSYCEHKKITHAQAAQTIDVRQWVATLHRNGLSGTSIQRSLSALRSFYKFLNSHGHLSKADNYNPAIGIQTPKSARKLPKAIDTDNMQQLLSIAGEDWLSVRDRAILELFYSSGLRLSELVDLNITAVDLPEALVTVTGKGKKTRTLPVGRFAIKAIHQWLNIRNDVKIIDEQALFISQRGSRLTQRSIQLRLKKHSQEQGLGQSVHPHMLRHSFASHMLESSSDLRSVQELLGHANISTTQVYTHLDFQHLAKVYDKAHPRASKKKPASKAE